MPYPKGQHNRARTKTIATVGPACRDPEVMFELILYGVDVFRLNMAHGDPDQHERTIRAIREVSERAGRPVGILVDLAGPKIRLGTLFDDPTDCREGDQFRFVEGREPQRREELTSNYEPLIDELSVGDQVMLADGTVSMEVVAKGDESAYCRVVGAGTIRSRQGINLPGVRLSVPTLTDQDLEHVRWVCGQEIDFLGMSFVRGPEEVRQLKEMLRSCGRDALVVAKIEKREALNRLDEIVEAADAVMVARGDLGVETDVARMALVQKQIIQACRPLRRPVIVATQMLESMHHSRRPTRAEATDVANAVLDGADACMLSGETAIGEFPREAVRVMNRIMLATEELLRDAPLPGPDRPTSEVHPVTAAVVYGAGKIAHRLNAKLVVIVTRSGSTARMKAKQRDFIPTLGVSDSEATLRRLCLFWGITPLPGAPVHDGPELRAYVERWGQADGYLSPGDRVVFVTGTGMVSRAHNLLVVHEVEP